MTDLDDLATYVVNLPRRKDRRAWMEARLPATMPATYTSDLDVVIDGRQLAISDLQALGIKLFEWQIETDNPWWNRPLKYGEIGCALAHLACWNHAEENTTAPYILILEDDATLTPEFTPRLLRTLNLITELDVEFDLLYLGRDQLRPDTPTLVPGIVQPGYSHCSYAYLLTRRGLRAALSAELTDAIVPVDEFLPALYTPHPRPDLRVRFAPRITALAFDPPLVTQRPKDDGGSDTEDSDFIQC
ncbi:glycosyltransferase family 25 protein [Nocardia africana]|uniref:Glycosyltransferase family 25 protein n=1 Tax=Nocardia africana TaxID=134964 RepID=A0ABW6NCZ3_9NOCA